MAAASPAKTLFGADPIATTKVAEGLTKATVREGAGSTPARGQTVTVHYRGKLSNGTEFDASYNRGKPFQFRLGVGQVISGWDLGVATMKKGERAVLTCEYTHAYGEDGIDDVIPPRATLHFDVELLEFK